mgnify:CR=1 FL=1
MNYKLFYLTILSIFCVDIIFLQENNLINQVIANTDAQYKLVEDYEVDIIVSLSVPAFRMPKKKYKVLFKQPDFIKVTNKGFGILPKTGMFTSPNDNFNNLTNMSIVDAKDLDHPDDIIISGLIIVDSLKVEMPNEYAKLTFKPTVEVRIDTSKWVIKSVITKIDTLKLFEIYNFYESVTKDYYMPTESIVKYYIKDKKLSNWLKKDLNSIVGDTKKSNKIDMIEGNISVKYENYKINSGLSESIFLK